MNTLVTVASVASAAAIAAPSISPDRPERGSADPELANDDPVFAAIEAHRRALAELRAIHQAKDESWDKLPDEATRSPCVPLYPRRSKTCETIDQTDDHYTIRMTNGPIVPGEHYTASSIGEIEQNAVMIPEEDREDWTADRIRALRADRRKVARARRKFGYSQLVKRSEMADKTEFAAGRKLIETVPTSSAGVRALYAYAIEVQSILLPDDDSKMTLLQTLAKAHAA